MNPEDKVTYFARTNSRSASRRFGIHRADRRFHMYILGRTGTGKSSLLAQLVCQDFLRGEGFALLDPHGDLVERALADAPTNRRSDVIYFNVPDPNQPIRFNPLYGVPAAKRPLVAAGLIEAFKKVWTDAWGVRLEHILRNTLLTLLDQPETSMADILRIFDDESFRKRAVERTQNQEARRFWTREYAEYPGRYRADAVAPIQNKVSAFLADPVLRKILTETKSSFRLRRVMDEGKVLLVNLGKGKIGEGPAALLGALLVSLIGAAGLSRADAPEESRRDFFVYLDEFQTFTTKSLATMLAELRKYRVGLILANQYLSQVDKPVADAVLGNVGTLICFRLGPADATHLFKEFGPDIEARDLMNLPNRQIYIKLMIDGAVSRPFSAETLTVPPVSSDRADQSGKRADDDPQPHVPGPNLGTA